MVEIRNLKKAFGNSVILDGIDLTIQDGEVITIIGKSGTGKSVLLKNIIGLIPPDDGRILVDGTDITGMTEEELDAEIRTKMGMVFQYGALWDSMTIEENIALGLKFRLQVPAAERHRYVRESLELVGLGDVGDKYPDELSGGMKKRAAIARAIAVRPKYLLYDEPTTGLDPVLTNLINGLIRKLNRELNITSIVISHDVENIPHFSDRVGMLYEGKIIHLCPAAEMWQQENEIFNRFIHGETDWP